MVDDNNTEHSDPEDILSTSLGTLYDYAAITYSSAGSVFSFTAGHRSDEHHTSLLGSKPVTITLVTPDTISANWHLHASSIWVSSLFLAGHLEDLHLDQFRKHNRSPLRILELGAGAGLPGILIAKMYEDVQVTLSDYPDEELIRTLCENVKRNDVSSRCQVVSYDWGSEPLGLLADFNLSGLPGFDVIVAADTLWNPELHSHFIDTLRMTLRKTFDARVYLIAGLHTGRYTLDAFLKVVVAAGLEVLSATERAVEGSDERPWNVERAEGEDERERRKWVLWTTLKWKEEDAA